jgi:hypothetical protein
MGRAPIAFEIPERPRHPGHVLRITFPARCVPNSGPRAQRCTLASTCSGVIAAMQEWWEQVFW